MSDFEITRCGLVCTQVCTSLPLDEATARLNREMPTGISSAWTPSDREEQAPVACADRPETHTHYMFTC